MGANPLQVKLLHAEENLVAHRVLPARGEEGDRP